MPKILNCFEIKNETDKQADLYFYGDIVSDWWGAWQDEDQYPNAVKDFLTAQAGKDLNIYINSGGGSVFAGIAIYNMIQRHATKNKVQIYYGPDMWPAHVNVFSSHNHAQCIDAWTKYSSLASSVRKTLHAVVFDPAVVKFNSMANSSFKTWMEQNRSRFPSFDPSLLFRSSIRRPGVHV